MDPHPSLDTKKKHINVQLQFLFKKRETSDKPTHHNLVKLASTLFSIHLFFTKVLTTSFLSEAHTNSPALKERKNYNLLSTIDHIIL